MLLALHPDAKIYVAGAQTLIGSALIRQLQRREYRRVVPSSQEPDLSDRQAVSAFFGVERPEYVFIAAGRSGGIVANQTFPASLMLDNLVSTANVVDVAHQSGVKKLLYLASSCCYPRSSVQPMPVEALMTGLLEPSSEAYATAKLAGIQLCRAYRRQFGAHFVTAIPANAFGPGDDFGRDAHVIGALMRRAHSAKIRGERAFEVWGTGRVTREFVYADDVADGCIFAMKAYDEDLPINIGSGSVLSIAEVAGAIAEVVGFGGTVVFDATKPDGAPMKALDSRPIHALGWHAPTPFQAALRSTYDAFQAAGEVD